MVDFKQKEKYDINDLLEIMRLLCAPGGCPWDAQQTHMSIRKNLIEETYEVIEAIDKDDKELMTEELGDLLMQVVFHAQMEQEAATSISAMSPTACAKSSSSATLMFSARSRSPVSAMCSITGTP